MGSANKMSRRRALALLGIAGAGLVLPNWACSRQDSLSSGARRAIASAGSNATQLRSALDHFSEPNKREAMEFLVAETPRRMHRKHKSDHSWDLAHQDYTEIIDAEVITARELIDNVNLAFRACDAFPWARDLYRENKPLFFSGVLPYRLGTSSLDQLGDIDAHWRQVFLDKSVYEAMQRKHDLTVDFEEIRNRLDGFAQSYNRAKDQKERNVILRDIVDFFEVDFFHKQGFGYFPRGPEEKTLEVFFTSETKDGVTRKGGRCTDLDNIMRRALMSIGIPTSSVRFTAWPHVDTNHEVMRVILGEDSFDTSAITHKQLGRPFEFDPGIVSTVLEENWGQRDEMSELVWNLRPGETLPWYMGFYPRTRSTRNVTARYGPVSSLEFNNVTPGGLVYLGVMNNDSDTQLGTATVIAARASPSGHVKFGDVGRGVRDLVYVPYSYDKKDGKENARIFERPFVLKTDGGIRKLGLEEDGEFVSTTIRNLELEPKKDYRLLVFGETAWETRERVSTDETGAINPRLSDSGLYILKDGRGVYSRPFVVTDGIAQKL